jgi:acyl-CoA hydrolase
MRTIKFLSVIALLVMALVAIATAGQNKFGVADLQKINFLDPIRVGDTVLPQGSYEVRHVMEGDTHIMLFKQLGVNKPAEARVKCTLVQLGAKADQTQKIYAVNSNNERVLRELIFKGDLAKHVF